MVGCEDNKYYRIALTEKCNDDSEEDIILKISQLKSQSDFAILNLKYA